MSEAKSTSDQALQQARFEEQYRDLASLAGGLAHEIKNPLSTIRMNVQLLAEDLADPQTQEQRRALRKIDVVQRECDRLSEILDDFLRFARITELNLAPVDVNGIVEDIIEFSRPRIEAAGILLREDLPPNLPKVRLDADLFRQAMLNLLLNAESVMKSGGELIVQTRKSGSDVAIDVIDTGPGMTAELKEKIFKPFFSTRPGGTGLGLPTTKRIVEAHGGQITVDSEPGKGTAFHIAIPYAKEEATEGS
ncbi:two-component sensor histidine kinase [bacterium]|nr:two-component sensor histidine kinase [bacterium]